MQIIKKSLNRFENRNQSCFRPASFYPPKSTSFNFVDNIIVISFTVITTETKNFFLFSFLINIPPTDPPEVTLTLGSTLNPDDIKENDDVYFECNVKANPNTVKISWSHDVSTYLFIQLY